MIANHIPYVIGMKKAIGDEAAIEFAVALYDALGAGKSVEFAYKLACNAIQWASIPEHLIPILNSAPNTVKQVRQSDKSQNIGSASLDSNIESSLKEESGLATITFRGDISSQALAPRTDLFIDGIYVSSAKTDQVVDINVRLGQHTIYAKRGLMTSNSLKFTIGQAETIEFACSMKLGILVNKLILTQLRTYRR